MSMDIQGNLTKIPLSENAILHQSGVSFFSHIYSIQKRKKRFARKKSYRE